MSAFDSIGPFVSDLTISERGVRVLRLMKAMRPVAEALPAAAALGDPHSPARRAQAIAHLDAMPPAAQSRVLTAYANLCRKAS